MTQGRSCVYGIIFSSLSNLGRDLSPSQAPPPCGALLRVLPLFLARGDPRFPLLPKVKSYSGTSGTWGVGGGKESLEGRMETWSSI